MKAWETPMGGVLQINVYIKKCRVESDIRAGALR
jgi:hypothetical protein